ncbi:DUF4347 domain-containing protein, partial [Aquaspirillum soli]
MSNVEKSFENQIVSAPAVLRPAVAVLNQGRLEAAFIDTSVADWEVLAAGVPEGIEVVLLDGQQNGVLQMAEWAKSHTGYDAIHILSHGSAGNIRLGTADLNKSAFNQYQNELSKIGNSLTVDGDILVYGCHVANGEVGQEFIGKLAQATGADIAASDDLTGNSADAGDWMLEYTSKLVEAINFNLKDYKYYLSILGQLFNANLTYISDPKSGTIGSGVDMSWNGINIDISQSGNVVTLQYNQTTGYGVGGLNIVLPNFTDTVSGITQTSNTIDGTYPTSGTATGNPNVNLTYNAGTNTFSLSLHSYPEHPDDFEYPSVSGTITWTFTATGAGDSIPPTFDVAPSTGSITSSSFTPSASLDESGTVYYVVVPNNATAPTVAEVKAGTASGGGAALASGNSAANTGSFDTSFSAVTGLTASTDYDVYFVAKDAANNDQASVTKVDVTTSAAPDTTPPVAPTVGTANSATAVSVTAETGSTVELFKWVDTNSDNTVDNGEVTSLGTATATGGT